MAENLLPTVFRKSPAATASYDWTDYTTGVGYRKYYGACSVLSGGKTYFLTSREVDSTTGDDTGTDSTMGSYTTARADMDIDFDITFNLPAIVGGGDAYINSTMWIDGNNVNAETTTITIYHVSTGGVETSIGTATHNRNDATASRYFRNLIKVAVTSKQFVAGEKLRVNFSIDVADGDCDVRLYHDPTSLKTQTDYVGRTIGTDLTCDIPFKIDL